MAKKFKQAYALPIVLVFMVVSQLIYWGIIRLNQTNSQQFKNLQQYYQAQIIFELANELLDIEDEERAAKLEHKIQEQIQLIDLEMKDTFNYTDEWQFNSQFGLYKLTDNPQYEQYWVYTVELYVTNEGLNYCPLMSNLYCHGQLNADMTYTKFENNELNLNKIDWIDSYNESLDYLLSEGFRPVFERRRNRQFEWKDPQLEKTQLVFNHMIVDYQPLQNEAEYLIYSLSNNFQTSFSTPINQGRALLRYYGQIYEREIEFENESS